MQKSKDKRTYYVGLVSGLVHKMEDRKRGDILECDVNEWAIYTSVNRGILLTTSDEKPAEQEKAFEQFAADLAGEDVMLGKSKGK